MIYQTQTAEEFYNQLYKLHKPQVTKVHENQILIVDQMNVDEELVSQPSIDLRYSLDFEHINKTINSNNYKTLIVTSLQYELIETNQYQIQYQPKRIGKQDKQFIDKSENIINYVIEYIKVNNTDEKDILIYCQDLDEMDLYRRNLIQYSLFQIHLILPNFVTDLWHQQESQNKKNIYLALEPAKINSDKITLIFQTKNRIQTHLNNKNTNEKLLFVNQTTELSLYELFLRDLPQAEKYPSKTIYLFSSEEYLQLRQFPEIIKQEQVDALQIVKNHLRNTVSQQLQQFFAIIISILQTPGLLLKQELNTNSNQTNNLTIRTSPYWSKTNDALSWVSIITYCGTRIEKLIESDFDPFEYQQFEDWCSKQSINIIKVFYTLGYLQYWSEENNYTEISVIKTMGDIPLLRKQSSLQERTYERDLIQLIAQHFQVAQLQKGSKSYQIDNISYNIHPRSTQQYLGHLQQNILILSIQDNQILCQTQLLHNLQRKESIQYKEQLFPYQGISMMKQIMQNNGIEILTFEKENNCQIEMNLDLNLISLQSEEDNFEETEKKFQSFLQLKKQNVLNCEVEIPFHNDTKFTMGSGGVILDWGKQYMNKNIIVRNLPLDIVEQDVRDLFEEFELKTLKLDYLKESSIAKITLNTQADIDDLIIMYDQCEYEGKVIGIQRELSRVGFLNGKKNFDQFQYEIFYYGQLSKGKANVQFHKIQQAIDRAELLNNQTIDGKKVQVKQIDDTIQISNLHQFTTTYDLLQFCGGHQEVLDISHEVQQISESRNDPTVRLNELIKINADQQLRNIHLLKFKRKMQGLRKATYKANSLAQLQTIVDKMQGVKFTHQNYELKLYCVGIQCGQYQVNTLIRQLIEQKLQEFQQVKHLYKLKFIELDIVTSDGGLSKQYQAILKSREHQLFQKIENTINQIITGTEIQIKDSQFLQGQQGQNIQRYLEDKYGVLIKYNRLSGSVRVVGTDQIVNEVQQEIQAIIDKSSLKQQIQLSPKQIKQIIGHDGSGLQKLELKFNVQLKYDSRLRELSVSGQHQNIEAVKVAVNQILSNQQDTNSQELGQKICTICLDNMENPFLLQVCSHSFCFECLSMTMQNALSNYEQLPIKCPQCKSLIIVDDINNILNLEQQEKLKNLSINKYIQDNIQKIAFCYNQACPAINYINGERYDCNLCMKTFCSKCKQNYHPGMTCEEYKIGDCALLLALMAKEDIRRCPNCKVLCQRISGCYRVTCPTCQQSICWKNKADGKPCMMIFKQSSECYDHLTKVHGGYW